MSPFKRERLSKEVKSGIKDTAVYPSASHTPSGGGGVHTPAKVDLDEASEAPARISYSQVQIGRDPPQICPPPHFHSMACSIYRPFLGVKHMLTRTLPTLKLFMTWHSGWKSNFLKMSDVMIYSPFDMHVPKQIAEEACLLATRTPN